METPPLKQRKSFPGRDLPEAGAFTRRRIRGPKVLAGNGKVRKHPKTGASRRETESAQSYDAKEATADGTPEGPDLHRVFLGPPTQGRRETTLDAEWKPPKAHGGTPGGLLGAEAGKGRSRGGQERPPLPTRRRYAQLFQSFFFPIRDIATYKLNLPTGQFI